MSFKKFAPLTLLFLALFFSFCTQAQEGSNIKIPAAFKFYTLHENEPFTAADIEKNKKTFILFFDATCEHCQREVSMIGKRYKDFRNVHFYLVTMDDAGQAGKFMSTYGKQLNNKKNVTVLLDPDRTFMINFKPERFPGLYIYSAGQELVWHKDGDREVDDILKALNGA